MKANPKCRRCGVVLDDENWYPSNQERYYVCNKCVCEKHRLWREANPDKAKAIGTRAHRKRGERPFNENKECPQYLGVHVAERVLSHAFKDVERMPMHNPGFDFICNRGKRIDVKSSCLHKDGVWSFNIRRNIMTDYFLCLAFDNRDDLTPLHAWLIPGHKLSHRKTAAIRPSTIHRWSKYALDITKISACCATISGVE